MLRLDQRPVSLYTYKRAWYRLGEAMPHVCCRLMTERQLDRFPLMETTMGDRLLKVSRGLAAAGVLFAVGMLAAPVPAAAQAAKPNILFIMGDDIGWMQVGVYHRGIG